MLKGHFTQITQKHVFCGSTRETQMLVLGRLTFFLFFFFTFSTTDFHFSFLKDGYLRLGLITRFLHDKITLDLLSGLRTDAIYHPAGFTIKQTNSKLNQWCHPRLDTPILSVLAF